MKVFFIWEGLSYGWTEWIKSMATPKKENDHEIPDLAGLESENIIVRKKRKERDKPPFTEYEAENRDRQPERKEWWEGLLPGIVQRCRSGIAKKNPSG
jgi:hypothetical protein